MSKEDPLIQLANPNYCNLPSKLQFTNATNKNLYIWTKSPNKQPAVLYIYIYKQQFKRSVCKCRCPGSAEAPAKQKLDSEGRRWLIHVLLHQLPHPKKRSKSHSHHPDEAKRLQQATRVAFTVVLHSKGFKGSFSMANVNCAYLFHGKTTEWLAHFVVSTKKSMQRQLLPAVPYIFTYMARPELPAWKEDFRYHIHFIIHPIPK